MNPKDIVDLAVAVRRGQRTLGSLPQDQRVAVQQASRRMTDAQFSRLSEQTESRSRLSNRAFATRGLHDGPNTR